MATKDLKFVQDIYKMKDERSETYYLKVIGIENDNSETILLDHINNKNATGAKVLQNLTNRVKNDYAQLLIEEYRAFSPGSSGATEPVQRHQVLLKSNFPVKSENSDMFNMFGGFQGFVNFTSEQARTRGQIDAFNDRLDEVKEQKSQLLTKIGTYESENKKLELDLRRKEDQLREMKWTYEDKIRDLVNENEKELRKYKGQNAIINAGVQGLGSLMMKKLNISGDDLAGLLGLEPTGNENQNQSQQSANMPQVEVEPDNVEPEKKHKADLIYKWCLRANKEVFDKVYAIFGAISVSETSLNDLYELINSENEVQY